MLKFENISFKYDNKTEFVLNGLNFEIDKGETLAILGASGSGKSTALRLIAGLETPQSGNIYIQDKNVNDTSTEKRKIGYVFQEYALFPHMTVFDNIKFALSKKDDIKKLVNDVSNLVGISDLLNRYPNELSGGQRQRVALARAIVYKPNILLLDEPFSNLDTDLKDSIRKELKEILKETNITTVLVTHDEFDANILANKIIKL